ncbi:MAG TPA: rhomboid family intramembrane serine protease [Paracoccaceae bacterium]|nr:rhomboid family intramembrane serine protease [Paracoccaceae bacterium]
MRDLPELPEDPRDMPRLPLRRAALPPLPAGLKLALGAMVAIELVLTAADSGLIGARHWRAAAIALFGFQEAVFDGSAREYWPGERWAMLVTHAFLHGGLVHLAMNVVVLLSLGKLVTARVGGVRTVALLFLTAIGGGLVFGLIGPAQSQMVGASGAVFGFIGLWQYGDWRFRLRHGLTLRPVVSLILGLAFANLLIWWMLRGGLAWEAHLGGFLAGWFCGWAWRGVSGPGGPLPGARPW